MSATEESAENQAANDGNSEEQKPQESDPQEEIVDVPTQPADQNGGDIIGEDSAQATEVDKEGEVEKVKDDEKEEKSEVVDANNDAENLRTADDIRVYTGEEQQSPAATQEEEEEDSKMEEPAMSVVISEPDKDVTTQEANAQTEGRESPVGNADVSAVSPGKVAESQTESESPLVAPPTSKAEKSIDSGTPAKNNRDQTEGIAKDGFTANGKYLFFFITE